MINILIRNKYRPELLRRCLKSVADQTYRDYRVITACDSRESWVDADKAAMDEFNFDATIMKVFPDTQFSHYWNLYFNKMINVCDPGWIVFLDNDDYLASPTVLQELSEHLEEDKGIICQFLRNGKPKPSNFLIERNEIKRGLIGGGSLVVHTKHAGKAQWDGEKAADFRYIKKIEKILPLKFIKLVLQITDQKNNGQ